MLYSANTNYQTFESSSIIPSPLSENTIIVSQFVPVREDVSNPNRLHHLYARPNIQSPASDSFDKVLQNVRDYMPKFETYLNTNLDAMKAVTIAILPEYDGSHVSDGFGFYTFPEDLDFTTKEGEFDAKMKIATKVLQQFFGIYMTPDGPQKVIVGNGIMNLLAHRLTNDSRSMDMMLLKVVRKTLFLISQPTSHPKIRIADDERQQLIGNCQSCVSDGV